MSTNNYSVTLKQSSMPLKATLFVKMLERLDNGTMHLSLPNGETYVFTGKKAGIHATLDIKNWAAIQKIMQSGDIGVAEAYRDGWIDSPNMLDVLLIALHNEKALDNALYGNFLGTLFYRIRHYFNRNTRTNSKKNIHAHYDIGNSFYRLWLDESMTYSSALFSDTRFNLEEAQYAKYDRMLKQLNVKAGDHILEIGCGWGAFAEYAACHYGCFVTGISLSKEQLAYAKARIKNTAAEGKVQFEFLDYRDLKGQYDAIVSIEMLEAVGEEWWPSYFSKVASCLKKGGRAAIQTITIANERFASYRQKTDFIQQYIFPGGMLPSPEQLDKQSQQAHLSIKDRFAFGLDYAATLSQWREQFDQHLHEIRAQGFDEAFIRLWRFYYWYCEAGFLTQRTDVYQLVLEHQ
ncbi:SAM-dependent methyltransferase [Agitococcus lubricus]|uniref:Cyclopropane-fatty-acyl-phospholipid synthase n=1 Tax=Agitococcus lubricus TaxID=1077255 RepID=A0A2T5IVI7_9GAMM|nr:cyclopropane-fatty-acyl-phospholipid synthase family protein [Agitococcus lubricus]PTQ87904.1 cyclopropane-fatty-acyl-phospholipid synthase [Agitococcus lubricus]